MIGMLRTRLRGLSFMTKLPKRHVFLLELVTRKDSLFLANAIHPPRRTLGIDNRTPDHIVDVINKPIIGFMFMTPFLGSNDPLFWGVKTPLFWGGETPPRLGGQKTPFLGSKNDPFLGGSTKTPFLGSKMTPFWGVKNDPLFGVEKWPLF